MSFISSLQEPITVLRVNPSVCLSTDQADLFYLTINISHNPAAILWGKLWSDASTASLPGFSTVTDRQQAGGGRQEMRRRNTASWPFVPSPACGPRILSRIVRACTAANAVVEGRLAGGDESVDCSQEGPGIRFQRGLLGSCGLGPTSRTGRRF